MHKISEYYAQHFCGLCTQFLQIMCKLCTPFTWLFITFITLLVRKHGHIRINKSRLVNDYVMNLNISFSTKSEACATFLEHMGMLWDR